MDALAFLLGLPDWRAALAVGHKYQFLTETEAQAKRQRAKPRRKPTYADVEIYEELLEERAEWLLARGLSPETIRVNRLGHNGAAFVIPVFDEQMNVVTLRYRNDEEICGKVDVEYDDDFTITKTRKIPKYRGWSGANEACLYPAWKWAADRRDYVVLVEGELDALRLWQENIPALTSTNGAGQQGLVLVLLARFFEQQASHARRRPRLHRVVICGDRDGPGILTARKLFLQAREEYNEVIWIQWPASLGKDISEVLAKGLSFDEIYEQYGFNYEIEGAAQGNLESDHDRRAGYGADAGAGCGRGVEATSSDEGAPGQSVPAPPRGESTEHVHLCEHLPTAA